MPFLGWQLGRAWVPARARDRRLRDLRQCLPLPDRRGHVRHRDDPRRRLGVGAARDGARRLAEADACRRRAAVGCRRGSSSSSRSRSARSRSPCSCTTISPHPRARARARRGLPHRRARPDDDDLPREPRDDRPQPGRGPDRLAHGAREPAQADRRPRAARRAGDACRCSTSTASRATTTRYGHLAGDALLDRLGTALSGALEGRATAYRMGGDEFCALSVLEPDGAELAALAAAALCESGDGFEISSSYGIVSLPQEAATTSAALRLADSRMYAQKQQRRSSAGSQSKDVLLRALEERSPILVDSRLGRRRAGRRDRSAPRPRRQRSRLPQPRRRAARRRQGRDPGRDPRQEGSAAAERMGVRPPAHADRRADHRRRAGAASGRPRRSLDARALGRPRLSGRPERGARSRSSRGS